MTTTTTSSPCSQATNATFQAWVAEVVTALFTTIGLTQTADTGQINPATVAAPVTANAQAGYVIGRFNDTLQSTKPIFFKLEFGSGSGAADPAMIVTVGTGSNGSGTLTGTLTTRRLMTAAASTGNSTTSFTSRFCYNAALGVFWMAFKFGMIVGGTGVTPLGTVIIGRSNDNTGAPTGDGVYCLTCGTSATSVATAGAMECLSFDTNTVYGGLSANWGGLPFNTTSTTYLGNVSVIPGWVTWPFFQLSMHLAVGVQAEIAIGSTYSLAMIGATAVTYISVGPPFSGTGTVLGYSPSGTLCLPWQ